VAYDWFHALARYTRVNNLPPGSQVSLALGNERTDEVYALQGVADLHRRLTYSGKLALRDRTSVTDQLDTLRSEMRLWINRFDYHVTDKWDAALEYRVLSLQGAGDNSSDGFLFEINRLLFQHLRLGVGYNLTDFTDNELSANDYSAEGVFLRIQGKY
jgi:hypothetical protein